MTTNKRDNEMYSIAKNSKETAQEARLINRAAAITNLPFCTDFSAAGKMAPRVGSTEAEKESF
jgi:hypothetical protein